MTAVVIFAVFGSIAAVGWVGAQDVVSHVMTAGQLVQFIFYAGIVAGGVTGCGSFSSMYAWMNAR